MLKTLGQQYTLTEKDPEYNTPEFVPVSNGVTYINPTPGDLSACEEVKNGYWRLGLLDGASSKMFLAKDQQTAELVLQQSSVQLLLNESNVIVGIVEQE